MFGTAMGSTVSVTVANLMMENVEERPALATADVVPKFWKRYVDISVWHYQLIIVKPSMLM